jgi:hypothetical protein
MNKKRVWLVVLCLAWGLACLSSATPVIKKTNPAPTKTAPAQTTPVGNPLGDLIPEKKSVEHGPDENSLAQVSENAPFFTGDAIRVTQGGEALLDFQNQLRLRLFNDTQSQVVSADVDTAGTPVDVLVFLAEGGFTGELTRTGGKAVFQTPGGAEITVLGTAFWIVYDPIQRQTSCGNFHGSMRVSGAGIDQPLPEGYAITIPDGQAPGQPRLMSQTQPEFENQARIHNSPIVAASSSDQWSYEMTHRFLYSGDMGEETDQITWNSQFVVEGESIIGTGTGKVEGSFICPLPGKLDAQGNQYTDHATYQLTGTFSFELSGSYVKNRQGGSMYPILKGYDIVLGHTAGDIQDRLAVGCVKTADSYIRDYYTPLIQDPIRFSGQISVSAINGSQWRMDDLRPPNPNGSASLVVTVTTSAEP